MSNVKSTGLVRKLDFMGRYVLPMEMRKVLNINPGDSMEIFVDNTSIILRKYEPECVFCGQLGDIVRYKEKNICTNCLQELKK